MHPPPQHSLRFDLSVVHQGRSDEGAAAAPPQFEVELEWCGGVPAVPREAARRLLRKVPTAAARRRIRDCTMPAGWRADSIREG